MPRIDYTKIISQSDISEPSKSNLLRHIKRLERDAAERKTLKYPDFHKAWEPTKAYCEDPNVEFWKDRLDTMRGIETSGNELVDMPSDEKQDYETIR